MHNALQIRKTYLDETLGVDEDVARLKITVDHVTGVDVFHHTEQLCHDVLNVDMLKNLSFDYCMQISIYIVKLE